MIFEKYVLVSNLVITKQEPIYKEHHWVFYSQITYKDGTFKAQRHFCMVKNLHLYDHLFYIDVDSGCCIQRAKRIKFT